MTRNGKVYVTEAGEPIHGIMAEFATPAEIVHACEAVRDAGYTRWDSFTPFPVHGMEEAMGIKRTILPVMVFFGGMTGASLGMLLQWWTSAVDYQMVTQGKPYFAWQAFVPITFELGILLSAFTTIIGMLALNALPRWNHPLLKKERFLAVSDDRFFICIEASDPKFDPELTRALLKDSGAASVELVEE